MLRERTSDAISAGEYGSMVRIEERHRKGGRGPVAK